jgi:hypothetical protein
MIVLSKGLALTRTLTGTTEEGLIGFDLGR